ncbi:HAD family hydrolase [Clostridium intestinale]|uniref:Hydrolase n=1 Tax=Clostridium intestinale URNW TaxID=1294142 RepID=U2NRV6_9CLOT|nr:HAD family hydrolase [Clostridium intestinale]ERK31581.1 hydrolase [Clostridium intestinale URNW]
MINTIIFDLDGTLLPLDTENFFKIYFEEIALHFKDIADPKELENNMWASTMVMIKNLDDKLNEEVFMEDFANKINGDIEVYKKKFDEFYDGNFLNLKKFCYESQEMRKAVSLLKEKGYNLVIATNPIFPLKAINHRVSWTGFKPEDFSYISSYERNHYCKPQVKFYEEILKDINKDAEECLMVGNDVQEDLVASKVGIKTYLINDYVINRIQGDIVSDYQGSYKDFYNFVQELPTLK